MSQKIILLKKVPIRVDFDGEDAERFQYVKKYLGLKQNTEVIRALISGKYNEIQVLVQKRKAQLTRESKAVEWLEKGKYNCPI